MDRDGAHATASRHVRVKWCGTKCEKNRWNLIFAPAPQDILSGIASGGSLLRDPVTGNLTIDGRSVNGTERASTGYDFGKENAAYHGLLRNMRVSLGVDNVWNEALP